jgi:hypothetical protein
MEFFYDLLAGDPEEISNSDSSRGSHHPSRECFMAKGAHRAGAPEGHVADIREGDVTPPSDPDDKVKEDRRVPPNPWLVAKGMAAGSRGCMTSARGGARGARARNSSSHRW